MKQERLKSRRLRLRIEDTKALVFVLLLGIGLAGLIFEIGVRFFVPVSDFFWQWDPVVGLKHIPNKQGRWIKRGAFGVRVQINSEGFRDREHSRSKAKNTVRIVLLGDSFIEALQVPFEQSISALLERQLDGEGLKADTVNLGVSGIGTARQYLFLREYGLKYEPDLVLLFFVGNDVSDNSKRLQGLPYVPYPVPNADGTAARDQIGTLKFTPFADQKSRLGFLTEFLGEYSKGYRLIREIMDMSSGLKDFLYRVGLTSTPSERVNRPEGTNFGYYELYRKEYRPDWAEAWTMTQSLLLATRDLSQASGARFAVVLIPAAWEVYPALWTDILNRVPAMKDASLDIEKPSRTLASFLTRNNIPVVNLLPEFRERASASPPLYIPGDAHWTAEGHRLAVKLLSSRVSALLQQPMTRSVTIRQKRKGDDDL